MSRIPTITDEELQARLAKLKPADRKDGELHFIEIPDLRSTAFTWSPKYTDPVKEAKEVHRFTSYHSYGAPAFFKPSIAEVLAQVPEEYLNECDVFEVVLEPGDSSNVLSDGHHWAITILYALPEMTKDKSTE